MGVRRGAVSRLVGDLLQSGLVFEGAKGESPRGRKPMHLYIDTRRRCALAADVNARRTALMVTDLLGQPLLPVVDFPTPRRPAGLVKQMLLRLRKILAEHPEFGACVGLGVVVSGIVDVPGVRLRYSPTLAWRNVDLRGPLRRALKVPVVVENSVKACILAQVWAQRGDSLLDRPVAFVNVSDGVGVGIAVDGKLLRGAHNLAGEFGHVTLNVEGPTCSCGERGCWEAYVSKRAVIARYLGRDPSWAGTTEPKGASLDEIIARARGGEARAIATLREAGCYLGLGLATVVKAVDPARIYLGGEITAGWDLIAEAVRASLRRHALIREAGETEIVTVPVGEHPRLRGAAALVTVAAFAAPVVA
jgi:predicted NBD/HSP70 family sugar kinase